MKLKIGDHVKFLNEVGGGKIIKMQTNGTYIVETEDGFEVPVMSKELILDTSKAAYETPSRSGASMQKPIVYETVEEFAEDEIFEKDDDEVNIYLAFVPENEKRPTNSDLNSFLVNDSNYFLMYAVSEGVDKLLDNVQTGVIEPNTKADLKLYKRDNLNEIKPLHIQMVLYKEKEFELIPPIVKELAINPVKFFQEQSYKSNDFFDERALVYTIREHNAMEEAVKMLSEKQLKEAVAVKKRDRILNKTTQSKSSKPDGIREIDLHIHELIDDEAGMSAKDMLTLQMETFEKEMTRAIKEKVKRVVFIHGIGNGKLKMELRSELQRKYKKYQFQDASFKEYGFGATMVLLSR